MPNWHGEQAVGSTHEWYTPPSLFEALGLRFDLDPAMPARPLRGTFRNLPGSMSTRFYSPDAVGLPPVPWVPVDRWYTPDDNGLLAPWSGRVWLNPPYGNQAVPFLHRMAEHRDGIALVFARTETAWWHATAPRAHLVVFLRDRLHHVRADGHVGRGAMGSALLAFGPASVAACALAGARGLGWAIVP